MRNQVTEAAAHTFTQVLLHRVKAVSFANSISIACTELGAYQVAPKYGPSLILSVLQVDYT